MALPEEALHQIQMLVCSGFYGRERIIEVLAEEVFAPGELDAREISAAVDTQIEVANAEQLAWPAQTDWDRLNEVFESLQARGIITLHKAGYTQSDGYSDVSEVYHRIKDKDHIIGYCFYHEQDVQRALAGGGLNLAFGPMNSSDEQREGPQVGKVICDELVAHNFTIDWDGTFNRRIRIANFKWQKRLAKVR